MIKYGLYHPILIVMISSYNVSMDDECIVGEHSHSFININSKERRQQTILCQ
jgi:hypothetical protein